MACTFLWGQPCTSSECILCLHLALGSGANHAHRASASCDCILCLHLALGSGANHAYRARARTAPPLHPRDFCRVIWLAHPRGRLFQDNERLGAIAGIGRGMWPRTPHNSGSLHMASLSGKSNDEWHARGLCTLCCEHCSKVSVCAG